MISVKFPYVNNASWHAIRLFVRFFVRSLNFRKIIDNNV